MWDVVGWLKYSLSFLIKRQVISHVGGAYFQIRHRHRHRQSAGYLRQGSNDHHIEKHIENRREESKVQQIC